MGYMKHTPELQQQKPQNKKTMVASRGGIRYCAVIRIADRCCVASNLAYKDGAKIDRYRASVAKLVNAKIDEFERLSGVDPECGTVHYLCDRECAYVVVTAGDYPQRTAFKFLQQFGDNFSDRNKATQLMTAQENTLSKDVRGWLSSLMSEYDDANSKDKVRAVQSQVNEAAGIMEQNIHHMADNLANLEKLESESQTMMEKSQQFKKSARSVKQAFCWQNFKLKMIMVCICLTILVIILISICTNTNACKGGGGGGGGDDNDGQATGAIFPTTAPAVIVPTSQATTLPTTAPTTAATTVPTTAPTTVATTAGTATP